MTLCSNCSFDNPPGMRFCGNCGTQLTQAAPDTSARLAPDQLGVMIGPDLLERFRKAGLEASGQRRNVTVLFVDLKGFSTLSQEIDGEELFDFIQQYTAMLMNDVYKYEGMVDNLAGDGLMALFGAPIAQENNAERAVRAALDMQEDIARLGEHFGEAIDHPLQVRIGLNAGSVIVGGIGSDKLMNYTAIGDTVNLASRLEGAANPGSILINESVYRQTKHIFDFESIPSLVLKNIKGPVTAFQVTGLKAEPGSVRGLEGFQAPMIGRDAEFKLIRSVVQRLTRQRRGGMIWVTGEAGLGKSRLKEELKASVDTGSVQVIEGQSLTYRKSIAYWIFQDLLRNYLGVSIDTPEQVIKDRLLQRVSSVLPAKATNVIPFLEHILALAITDKGAAQRIQFLDAEQLSHQIFIALRDLLIAESVRCPLLLILEDLHWVDEASLDLILQLIDSVQLAPLVIYGNSRPYDGGMLGKIYERAQKLLHDNFSSIQLDSLHTNESRQLFETLLTIPDLPDDFHDLIIQRCAGVPFYLEEIIRMLIEENVIYRDNGHWQLAPETDILSIGVPDNLQGLILARFDRLDMIQRRVLQISAVIGYQFSFPVLHGVLKYTPANSIESALSFLAVHEYIVLQTETPEKNYTFKHALVSDAIYGTLLKRDRRELHGQVGQAIETFFRDRLEGQFELLANHYFKSSMLDRALHYLILAGQKSERGYSNEQARQYYENAQGLLSEVVHTPQQEIQIHRGLGDILVTIGEYQAARDHYQAGLEKIPPEEKDDFIKSYCRLHRKIAVTFERQGDYEKSFARLKEAQQTLEAAHEPLPIELAKTLNEIGWTYFRKGDLEKTETFLVRSLNLVKDSMEYEVIASIYNRLGGVYFQREDFDKTSELVLKSLAIREKLGDVVAVARSYNNLGLLAWKRGEWEGALQNFNRSFELHANLGDVEGMIELRTNMGLLQLGRDNTLEAKKNLEDALATARQIGHSYHIGLACLHLGLVNVSVEDWRAAVTYCDQSLEYFRGIGVQEHLVEVCAYLGMGWLGLEDLEQAEKWGLEALDLFEQISSLDPGRGEDQGLAFRVLGDVARKRGDFEKARRLLGQSEAVFTSVGNQLERARTMVSLALLAESCEDHHQIPELLEEAQQIFEQMGAALDLRKLKLVSQRVQKTE